MSEIKAYDRHAQSLADYFIAGLKDGTGHLRKKWDAGTIPGHCYNFTTGKAYRGGNQWELMNAVAQLEAQGFAVNGDLRFGTIKQTNSVGARVRKGEKGVLLMAWKEVVDKRKEASLDDEERKRMISMPFWVFHASQIDGLPPVKILEPRPVDERLVDAQKVMDQLGVPVSHGGDQAYYSPGRDRIQMPERNAFGTDGDYMSVLLHEGAHATGHPSRLNRKFGERFCDANYALEELRAEMASFDICRRLGVPFDPRDHVAYVNHWIEAIKTDPREILRAATDVEKILTFMKVPEIEYEKVPIVEIEKPEVELPSPKEVLARQRRRSVRPGAEVALSL